MALGGNLILDGANDPHSVFIFQIGSTPTTASASSITFIRGAQACNVFWQVGSSATFGTNFDFSGHVFAMQSITATTGAEFHGQHLAREAAVTLDSNTITNDVCAIAPSQSPSASESASATPSPSESESTAPVEETETGGQLPNTELTSTSNTFAGIALILSRLIVMVIRRKRA